MYVLLLLGQVGADSRPPPCLVTPSAHTATLRPLTGCLDSLVYYKRLLVTLLEPLGESTREEREALNLKALGMLRKLEQVDPMRGARYRDLGEFCVAVGSRAGADGIARRNSCAYSADEEVARWRLRV